jgi:hypothetical protein
VRCNILEMKLVMEVVWLHTVTDITDIIL